jgi:lysine-2,3-aminomutase-related protein
MTSTIRSAAQICEQGFALPAQLPSLQKVAARYAIALPPALAGIIDRNDRNDPIARQFVPSGAELDHQPQELLDPIGDDAHSPVEGIVHRYPDRVLLKLTPICAVYCRFCFRREMVGPDKANALSPSALAAALDYIRGDPNIWEVILTGGDPLVLSARRLRAVMNALRDIDHVKVVRIHTRVPIADPARITRELVRALKVKGKATYVAVHVNHARELTPAARAACAWLADAGIPLLAQSVLLAGVNDRSDARFGRVPDQAVLFAPRRSGARHVASAYRYCDGAGFDAGFARPPVGIMPTGLRARYTGRPWQIADRAGLHCTRGRRWREFRRRGFQGTAASISAARIIPSANAGSTPDRTTRPRPRGWRSR